MCKIIIFGGTTEGRNLAEYCIKNKIKTLISVATEYGGSLITDSPYAEISVARLSKEEMAALFAEKKPKLVVDATHPFAKEVTENITEAGKVTGTEIVRLVREGISDTGSSEIHVSDIEEAIALIATLQGKVLVTTGSKELHKFTAIENYKERLVARVLSTKEVAKACHEIGFSGSNLICMQGPFSKELNIAMIKQYNCSYLLTKASGDSGGYLDKISACVETGIKAIVIGAPKEEGLCYSKCKDLIRDKFSIAEENEIDIIGIGPGGKDHLTKEAAKKIDAADIIIGARRIADSVAAEGQKIIYEYNSEKLIEYIPENCSSKRIAVVFSGDLGFYSGTKKLVTLLQQRGIKHNLIAGIGSIPYFATKLGVSWEDAQLVSNHGVESELISLVRDKEKVFSLLGSEEQIRSLAEELLYYNLGDVKIAVGERLSYPDEKITCGNPKDFTSYENDKLAVVYIENPNYLCTRKNPLCSISDREFERGDVPMTKEEVRTISISKLRLFQNAICYDIGAGTGSVSVEMSLKASKGKVYAIEVNKEALSLLEENKRKFKANNIEIIEGMAPDVMGNLPAPDCVFVGGTKGNMEQILSLVFEKNPKARVVINCITLESLAQGMAAAKKYGNGSEEIIQISASRSKKIGRYNMMNGENPIFIISFTGTEVK